MRIQNLWLCLGTIAGVSLAAPSSLLAALSTPSQDLEQETASLAVEVRDRGWIAFSARSDRGDWDLFLCRPDGSQMRPITRTPESNEFGPQFSRDGRQLLYRQIPRGEVIDNNRYGEQGSVILAKSDGTDARTFGQPGEFPWASWSPDGRQLACLSIKGIGFVDLTSGQTIRRLPRKGFFQQTTWSPDGQWICGVANSYGTGWSIARLNVATGEASPVNTIDCCTPDWFPDSREVIFSWRPRGQKGNNGYGWTQLWRVKADGSDRQLVYGEDGRHIYGGQISPDGQYVLFTGNMREDGDPGNAGAPMGLMRLKDGPVIGGQSQELRALHPQAKGGPALTLPVGWEPFWTASELSGGAPLPGSAPSPEAKLSGAPMTERPELARELHSQGWVVASAKTGRGDWDLFLMRPDGTDRRALTDSADTNEAGARSSPDGTRFLYYRMPKTEAVDNNTYGTFELVIAAADGTHPVSFGSGFQWASWGPDGRQISCLSPKGIQIVDVASRAVIRQMPRKGIVQQLVWSPDGRRFIGTANGLGPFWNIGCLDTQTGQIQALSETERYNCTPDWMPDSQRIVYARGIVPQQPGRAELWAASIDGQTRQRIYQEDGQHIYGACPSPDGRYLLFTRSVEDLGKVVATELAVIRWPQADGSAGKHQPVRLDLGPGWEPHWTFAHLESQSREISK